MILLIQVCLQVLGRTAAQPFVVPLGAAQSLMSDAAWSGTEVLKKGKEKQSGHVEQERGEFSKKKCQ